MLKLRLKKCGRKRQPSYRLVVMRSTTKRDGKAIEELGFYNPRTKELSVNLERAIVRIAQGSKPTSVVQNLLLKIGRST
ncbi:ribosomal protein S16 (plastid) [Cryptomonas paramecium]|uniref:Ribosomal protein S16 n=1 Tax=Cryptomonas paramaecium TaxID=2898 RepID=D2ISD5_9CRYP|nr:ribosomal protein S16 [Cryptomonas paramecium]ACT46827.1 ribosomal protein S16 [Cryptomonas paramecium]BDA97968.1 ribosomal protein S16 [Cryptomonas paramecium]